MKNNALAKEPKQYIFYRKDCSSPNHPEENKNGFVPTGKVYEYYKVPEKTYLDMKQSFSKGIYFNEQVKGKYRFKRKQE